MGKKVPGHVFSSLNVKKHTHNFLLRAIPKQCEATATRKDIECLGGDAVLFVFSIYFGTEFKRLLENRLACYSSKRLKNLA